MRPSGKMMQVPAAQQKKGLSVLAAQQRKGLSIPAAQQKKGLSVLTLNTSDGQPSCRTPGNTFEDQCNIQRAGISSTLRGLPHSPNILCLQELQKPPSHLAGAYELLPLAASSHRGKCMTLLHKESTLPDTRLIKQEAQGPCVLPHLSIQAVKSREFHLVLINGHLAPFKEGESVRFQRVRAINPKKIMNAWLPPRQLMECCNLVKKHVAWLHCCFGAKDALSILLQDKGYKISKLQGKGGLQSEQLITGLENEPFCQALCLRNGCKQVSNALDKARVLCPHADAYLIAGDMNMREHETAPMCNLLGLVDGWEAAGKPLRHRYTWDTHRNNYCEGGFMFKARYNRCMWTRDSKLSLQKGGLQVIDQPASKEDPHHFFSDHFGLFVQFDLGDPAL